jgi:hypothetical protein
VCEKRRFRDACDAGGLEGSGQRLRREGRGGGGEKLANKRKKEAKQHGSYEAVDKRKCSFSEEDNEAQKQQHEEGVGGSRASGEDAKKKRANARTTARKANVGKARDPARAGIAES